MTMIYLLFILAMLDGKYIYNLTIQKLYIIIYYVCSHALPPLNLPERWPPLMRGTDTVANATATTDKKNGECLYTACTI